MFRINIDSSEIIDLLGIDEASTGEMNKAAAALTAATKAKAIELANQKLHTRRKMFIEALDHFQVDENTWVVSLDAKAVWIDEGMPEHSMLPDLLKSKKAKTAKDGSKYVVVPFKHNKGKQLQTPAQQALLNTIKKELRAVGTTPNQIELTKEGKPKLGLVRSLDITQRPLSTADLRIGAGPRGHVAQGPTGIPLLKGIRVYQKEVQKSDGTTGIQRDVMTFRVASSKHEAQGRWHHPGIEGANIMDEAAAWARNEWDSKIAPSLMDRIIMKISR